MKETSYVEVVPTVRRYEWGKRERGALTKVFYKSSVLAGMGEQGGSSFSLSGVGCGVSPDGGEGVVEEGEPCAELWYGSHVSSPSGVSLDGRLLKGVTLDDVVSSGFVLGRGEEGAEESVVAGGSGCLGLGCRRVGVVPFLLKVLSISKPLSLQVHPDRTLARELHSSFPSVYLDDNHKPELAIALSEFETLCGFRDALEMLSLLESFPETLPIFGISKEFLSETISTYRSRGDKPSPGGSGCEDGSLSLLDGLKRDLFISMLSSESQVVTQALSSLVTRLESGGASPSSSSSSSPSGIAATVAFLEGLILRLHRHFPLDIGIISPILLNYYKLSPGDAVYIGAGTIHSYISGDCLECMANSDNVIRCGLTPKLKDVPSLIEAVNFRSNNAKLILNHDAFSSLEASPSVVDYFVDSVEEYRVQILSLAPLQSEQQDDPNSPPSALRMPSSSPYSLLLCLSGSCHVSISPRDAQETVSSTQCLRDHPAVPATLSQGKALLVKADTKVSLHPHPSSSTTHPKKDLVKLALVTQPRSSTDTPKSSLLINAH